MTTTATPLPLPPKNKPPPAPAASANKVPTIQSLKDSSMKRSASYNTVAHGHDPTREDTTIPESPTAKKIDQAGCDQMLKASLTGILNSGEVKSDARGRKVQDLLMDTQKDLRKQRRLSLGGQRGKGQLERLEGRVDLES
ncbi:hypothetical protein BJX99DRAFT_224267 [Aspergillus californicus]